MADSISWKDFGQHFDNIIPGVILTSEAMAFGVQLPNPAHAGSGFIQASTFVAISYAIGVVSALLSRMILDLLSENGLRAIFFQAWVHVKRVDLVKYCSERDDSKFALDLAFERKKHWFSFVAEWNSVYRAMLRTSTRPDVERRRSQGRTVRNLFFPAIFGAALLAQPGTVEIWRAALLSAFVIAILYSYAELTIMQEANDISEATPNTTPKLAKP